MQISFYLLDSLTGLLSSFNRNSIAAAPSVTTMCGLSEWNPSGMGLVMVLFGFNLPSRHGSAKLDEVTGIVPDAGHGLPPWLGCGFAHGGRSGFDGALEQRRNIGRGQGDLHSQRRFVRRSRHDGLFQVFVREGNAGEGQPGRAGFQFTVSLAVVVVEKAAGQSKRLFVKGEAGGDIVHIQNHVTEGGRIHGFMEAEFYRSSQNYFEKLNSTPRPGPSLRSRRRGRIYFSKNFFRGSQ